MGNPIERFLLIFLGFIAVFYVFSSFGQSVCEIKKVYHHIVPDSSYIEQGNLVLYVSNDFQVTEIPCAMGDDSVTYTYFLPGVSIKDQSCASLIHAINQFSGSYSIKVQEVVSPHAGIHVHFSFPSLKHGITYELFDAITADKAIVFRIYNKNIIDQLQQNHHEPVLRTLWNTDKPRIMIDPGHGGYDKGAVAEQGLSEKNLCLALGKSVAQNLQEQGCEVLLTRTSDIFCALDKRTLYAHEWGADAFISIHANATLNKDISGIETFYSDRCISGKNLACLLPLQKKKIMQHDDFMKKQSLRLAQAVHSSLYADLVREYPLVNDRRIKKAAAQVLLANQMPAVLVEVGFLSHLSESLLLQTTSYQDTLAKGIANGIMSFFAL